MASCAQCGLITPDDAEMCVHHVVADEPDWAAANRMMCDFVHRGVAPPASSAHHEQQEIRLAA